MSNDYFFHGGARFSLARAAPVKIRPSPLSPKEVTGQEFKPLSSARFFFSRCIPGVVPSESDEHLEIGGVSAFGDVARRVYGSLSLRTLRGDVVV